MNKFIHAVAATSAALLSLATTHAAASETDEPRLYVNGTLGYEIGTTGGQPRISLGGGVSAPVAASYGHAPAGSLAIGREFISERENAEPRYFRLEGELWAGKVKRNSLTVDGTVLPTNDSLDAQALFLNGLYKFHQGERYRSWIGLGIGWGRVATPAVASDPINCSCLGKKDATGLAYRLKLQVHRDLSDRSTLFAELGYVQLPAGSTGGLPSTEYRTLGVGIAGIGYEKRF